MPDIEQTEHKAAGKGEPWFQRWRTWAIGALALVLVAGAIAGAFAATAGTGGNGAGTNAATGGSGTTPSVPSTVSVALFAASTAEQEAKATYDAVIAKFGAVQPFMTISDAESQHIATLTNLAARHGVSLAADFSAQTPPATLSKACLVGLSTEQAIVAMYSDLLPEVSGYADLTQAFTNLKSASASHRLAFERCVRAAPTPATSSTTVQSVPSSVSVALFVASTDEQEAKATYDAVIAKFGPIPPFLAISDAENQHIATLATLAARHGVALPSGTFSGLHPPATLTAACQIGVRTEHNMVAMYDEFLSVVSSYTDLTQAFTNLKSASESHLSAFELCA